MADYVFGQIEFPTKYWTREAEDALRKDTSDPEISHNNGMTNLTAQELRNGEFEHLEAYFLQNLVPFDRYSDQTSEYDPMQKMYRPDKNINVEYAMTRDGVAWVPIDVIEKLYEELDHLDREETKAKVLAIIKANGFSWIPKIEAYVGAPTSNETKKEEIV